MQRIVPLRLVPMTWSQSADFIRISRLSEVTPALLTRISIFYGASTIFFDGRFDLGFIGDIELARARRYRPAARNTAKVSSAAAWLPLIVDDHMGAGLAERQCNRPTDAPASAGDQGDLTLKTIAHAKRFQSGEILPAFQNYQFPTPARYA